MISTALAALAVGQAAPAAPAPPQTAKPAAKPAAAAAAPKPVVEIKYVKSLPGLRPLAFAPGPMGATVAMTLEDRSVRIFDAKTRVTSKILQGHPQPAFAIAWSADGALLATGDESARIFIWDARTGQKLREIIGHQRGIQALSFNLPRTLLASTGKDDVVKVWDVKTGKAVATILGGGANLYSATYHPKDNTLASGTIGTGSRIYDGKLGTPLNFLVAPNLEEINDVAFAAGGTRLATAGRRGTTRLWDLKTLKGLGNFSGHTDWVIHASFSPNDKLIATGSSDKTVRVYDVAKFEPVAVIEGQSPVGSPVAWTADGQWLLTVGEDDTLQIHSVTPPAVTAPAKPAPKKASSKTRRKRTRR